MRLNLLLAVLAVLVVGRVAMADDGPAKAMSQPGHLVLGGSSSLAVEYVSVSPASAGDSVTVTGIAINPNVDYVVAAGITLGADAAYVHAEQSIPGVVTPDTVSQYRIAPRVGYLAALMPNVGLWPRAGISYTYTNSATSDVSSSRFSIVASVPVLFQPVAHFFIGIGPSLSVDVSNKFTTAGMTSDADKTTQIGLESIIGGWF